MSDIKSQSGSIGELLSAYLESHKDAMKDEWLARIRREMPTETQTMTTDALINHMPKFFDDTIEALRHYRDEEVRERLQKDADDHTSTRLQQGFDLPALLYEIAHLRTIFIYHLRMFEELNPDQGMVAGLFAANTVHRLLDKLGVDSAEQFLKAKQI
jgi:hypothetical protein